MKKLAIYIAILFFGILNLHGQDEVKNKLALEIGRGGGDGIIESNIYGIHFLRSFGSRFEGYLKYNFSKGMGSRGDLVEKFKIEENEVDDLNIRWTHFYSFGVGLNTKVVRTESSDLYINTGMRYLRSKSSEVGSLSFDQTGNIGIVEVTNRLENQIGIEVGIGYNRAFSEKYFAGGSIDYLTAGSRISVTVLLGVKF